MLSQTWVLLAHIVELCKCSVWNKNEKSNLSGPLLKPIKKLLCWPNWEKEKEEPSKLEKSLILWIYVT